MSNVSLNVESEFQCRMCVSNVECEFECRM